MEVVNKLNPNDEQLRGFLDPEAKGPICMVNLLKFRDRAEYADGRETSLSGAEAYAVYSKGVVACLEKVGGYLGFGAQVERLMLGEVEEIWDMVALAVYPSRQAMLEMIQLPEYQEIHVHRDAGLAGQLNIETVDFSGIWLKESDH
ncbi:MAG: DUF1330 domain-containing protein [Cellvibrionales bacterium]